MSRVVQSSSKLAVVLKVHSCKAKGSFWPLVASAPRDDFVVFLSAIHILFISSAGRQDFSEVRKKKSAAQEHSAPCHVFACAPTCLRRMELLNFSSRWMHGTTRRSAIAALDRQKDYWEIDVP